MRKFSPTTKALLTALALGGGAGVVYRQTAPVEVPARGGVLQMSRGQYGRLRSQIRRGDAVGTMARLNQGLQTGKIRYFKYPAGTSSAVAALSKQGAEKKSFWKWVKPNTPPEPAKTVAESIGKYFKKHPAATIPFAAGTMGLTGYGAWRVSRAIQDARARKAYQTGQGMGSVR